MSKEKKFLRQCCSCRLLKSKEDLIRITKNDKTIQINNNNEIQGRSVYICKNKECITTALKKNRIETALKCKIDENIKQKLSDLI